MAYNTTSSLDKLTWTDNVDFGNYQNRFGRLSWCENDSTYLDVNFKFFKERDNNFFRLEVKFAKGEAYPNQLMRLRNQLVIAVENFGKGENSSPVLIPTMSEDMDEELKFAHKMVEVVNQANSKVCVILLRYNEDNLVESYAQIRIFAGKEDREFSPNCLSEICCCLDDKLSLCELDQKVKFAGAIGCGDLNFEFFFRNFKVVRLHAILRYAAGAVRVHKGKG